MSNKRTLLRHVRALLGDTHAYDAGPLDVLTEDRVIVAIEKSGTLARADEVIDLSNRLLVPGLVESRWSPARSSTAARWSSTSTASGS